jgi:CRISPR-associated protein Cas1
MSSAALPGLPPPRPLPLKDRSSIIFIEKGNVDVLDGAFVIVDKNGIRTHIPIGGLACLMLEPGARISHAAVALASRAGTLIIWAARRASGSMRLVSLEAPAPTVCCIKRVLPLMMTPG